MHMRCVLEQRMCLGTFSRLRRSLATSTLYAAVRIFAERFLLYRKAISCKVKKRKRLTPLPLLLYLLPIRRHILLPSSSLFIFSVSLPLPSVDGIPSLSAGSLSHLLWSSSSLLQVLPDMLHPLLLSLHMPDD